MTRTIFGGIRSWASLSLAGLSGCGGGSAPEAADLVLRGGPVYTVDQENSVVRALAARDGLIIAAGSQAEIEPFIGENTRVIELNGRAAYPGFIEGHGHFLSLGNSKTILDFADAKSWDEIVAMVADAASEARPGEWISGRGWHQEKWDAPPEPAVEGAPVHASLSAASPNNPVLLGHASGHASFANAEAMRLAGLTRESSDPPGGELVRGPDGELTGLLRETAAYAASRARAASEARRTPEEEDARFRLEVRLASEEALSKGVTSFHDAGLSLSGIDRLKVLEEEGALTLRLYVMVRGHPPEELDARLPDYFMPFDGNDFLTVRSIKRQIDGALGTHGAWLLEPYEDMPSSTGLELETVDVVQRTAHVAIKHGFQVNTHAIGDRANREVLDIYQSVFDSARDAGMADGRNARWRIEHAQHVHPDDVPRFSQLGVIAAVQGVHATSDAPWIPLRLGFARSRDRTYLWRSFIDAGVVVANGTDVPVERIDPVASFRASVLRETADGSVFFPEQRMTRTEALRSYTINNAYAAFEEKWKGSLEPGKLADITILDRDIMTVPDNELAGAVVEQTLVGGVVRYTRES